MYISDADSITKKEIMLKKEDKKQERQIVYLNKHNFEVFSKRQYNSNGLNELWKIDFLLNSLRLELIFFWSTCQQI